MNYFIIQGKFYRAELIDVIDFEILDNGVLKEIEISVNYSKFGVFGISVIKVPCDYELERFPELFERMVKMELREDYPNLDRLGERLEKGMINEIRMRKKSMLR